MDPRKKSDSNTTTAYISNYLTISWISKHNYEIHEINSSDRNDSTKLQIRSAISWRNHNRTSLNRQNINGISRRLHLSIYQYPETSQISITAQRKQEMQHKEDLNPTNNNSIWTGHFIPSNRLIKITDAAHHNQKSNQITKFDRYQSIRNKILYREAITNLRKIDLVRC